MGQKMIDEETVCEFFLLINRLHHMVVRNIRFVAIRNDTNVYCSNCIDGLKHLGMKNPGKILWIFMEFLTVEGVLSIEEQSNFDSGVPIDSLIRAWDRLLERQTQTAA